MTVMNGKVLILVIRLNKGGGFSKYTVWVAGGARPCNTPESCVGRGNGGPPMGAAAAWSPAMATPG